MQAATVRLLVLTAAVAAQTVLIGLDGQRILQAIDRAGLLLGMAQGWMGWLRLGMAAGLVLLTGLLPLAVALALGGGLAWILRAYSSTPTHIDGLGLPIVLLVCLQCLVLAVGFALLPDTIGGDGWQNDGLIYAVMLVLVGTLWAFCNCLVLWRAAGGQPPRREPGELRRLHEIGRRLAHGIRRDASGGAAGESAAIEPPRRFPAAPRKHP